jgi:hypothetical protein
MHGKLCRTTEIARVAAERDALTGHGTSVEVKCKFQIKWRLAQKHGEATE